MLRARQTHWYSRFHFDLFGLDSEKLGSINWPDMAVAVNGRLKELVPAKWEKNVKILLKDQTHIVEFEHLRRGWTNDVRFMLRNGNTVLASVDLLQRSWRRPALLIKQPFHGEILRRGSLLAMRYEVTRDGETLGVIRENPGLRLRREISVDLPEEVDLPVQAFFLFLAMNYSYR